MPPCFLFLSFSPQSPIDQKVEVVAEHGLQHLFFQSSQVEIF